MLGEQGREQHIVALRAMRETEVGGLRSGGQGVVQQHGEASSACGSYFPFPKLPLTHHQHYGAPAWRSNETFVNRKMSAALPKPEAKKPSKRDDRVPRCSISRKQRPAGCPGGSARSPCCGGDQRRVGRPVPASHSGC